MEMATTRGWATRVVAFCDVVFRVSEFSMFQSRTMTKMTFCGLFI